MFANLAGTNLENNDRPTVIYDSELEVTDEMTLNMLAWTGMNIDQLRQRVQSVYIGRTFLLVTAAMFAEEDKYDSKE